MKQKPKILHLLYSGLGGHGSVFFSLVEADKENEFLYIAAFCGIEPVLEEYTRRCNDLNIDSYYFNKKPGLDINVYTRLFRLFYRSRSEIIFLHGTSFILPAVIAKLLRPRLKIIMRDTQAHHLKTRMDRIWLSAGLLFSKKVVFLTKESAAVAMKKNRLLHTARKIIVIPNGIDTVKYNVVNRLASETIFSIGMQSRLQTIKDHPTLFRAFKIVSERLPEYHLELLIAGDGETKKSLEQLSIDIGIDKNLKFTGMLSQDQLISFLHSLDIYVHASFGETMSNSIIQALSCGLPVVASDVWGINNMIEHEKNGVLYTSKDVDGLASILIDLIKNSAKRIQLGNSARQYAVKNYSNDSMFAKYREVFNQND